MKPSLDLNDPLVKELIFFSDFQMRRALSVPQRVESAVLPIMWTIKSPTKYEQVGSGVCLRIKDEYFILSASHIFDDIGSYALLLGTIGYERITTLSGERFSTKRGPSGTHRDDPIDASIFHIQSGLTDKIKDVALNLSDLDLSQPDNSKAVFMASGFRSKISNTIGNVINGRRECFPSIEYGQEEYSLLGFDRDLNILLAYENQVLINGRWQTSPAPRGMSGGAIIKVDGVNLKPTFRSVRQPRQLLSAITIGQKREKHKKPGVLIGTRIRVHLGLINECIPGLINKKNSLKFSETYGRREL